MFLMPVCPTLVAGMGLFISVDHQLLKLSVILCFVDGKKVVQVTHG